MNNGLNSKSGFSTDRYSSTVPVIKMRLENEIVRKREAETRRSETARSNDRYFQNWNLQTEKFDDWTSPRSAQLSHRQSRQRETEIEIEIRRSKLKQLYHEDRQKYEQILKKIKEEEEKQKWENMKDKVQNFRQSRTNKLKEFVQTKEHEQWKSTNTSFRAFESELKKQQQQEVWKIQHQEKENEKLRLAEEKKRETLELEKMVQDEKRRQEFEKKCEKEKKQQCRKELEEQIELLRSKDVEADGKRKEHEKLLAEALALEAIREEITKKEEEKAIRKKNGEFLTKQHLAKLRQRSREVASELDKETCIAEKLLSSGSNTSCDKEKIRLDIQRYLQLVEHHRQIEKERLQQTDFLFQEEAKRLWEKREHEWEAERLARKKLIDEVITVQKKQIEDKLLVAQFEREQLLQEREELVQSLESHHAQMKKKEMENKTKQFETKVDLLTQIDYKHQREKDIAKQEQHEREHKERAEMAYNEKHWAIAMDRLKL